MKHKITALVIMLCALTKVGAQEELDSIVKQFMADRQLMLEEFNAYVDSIDLDFSRYLARNWDTFRVEPAVQAPVKPQPKEEPVYVPDIAPRQDSAVVIESVPDDAAYMEPAIPKADLQIMPGAAAGASLSVDFFGGPVRVAIPEGYQTGAEPLGTGEKQVADYWFKLSKTGSSAFVRDLMLKKEALDLNSWGLYRFILATANACFSERQPNERAVFTVFLLNRAGYKARIGRINNALVVMPAIRNKVYGLQYIPFRDGNYYIMDNIDTSGGIASYNLNYGRAAFFIDLRIMKPPKLPINLRTVERSYNGKTYSIRSNKNLVDYYGAYPHTSLDIYGDMPFSDISGQSLDAALEADMKGKTEAEKLSFLLNFAQRAFKYKMDEDVFGREKFFFADETLFHPWSDCEDRAVLFSRLVKRFCDLKVLLVDYPTHVATAVRINEPGDAIVYNNDRYVICDPSYVGAPVGATMSGCNNESAEVIALR
ncbi:MAG: hypothetical protein LBD21_06670 [Tannerellaceae bacterium]|jgi:hypothetical protein|nr:hypothetical protein [Tannerellaceae bacterium]